MHVTYAPDKPQLFSLQEKPEDLQFELHAGITHGAGSGISFVYLWVYL